MQKNGLVLREFSETRNRKSQTREKTNMMMDFCEFIDSEVNQGLTEDSKILGKKWNKQSAKREINKISQQLKKLDRNLNRTDDYNSQVEILSLQLQGLSKIIMLVFAVQN